MLTIEPWPARASRDRGPAQPHRRAQVHAQRRLPEPGVHVGHRRVVAVGARDRVVHEDGQAAELLDRAARERRACILGAQVGGEEQRPAAGCCDLVDDGGAARSVATVHDDVAPSAANSTAIAFADARRGARHQRELILQTHAAPVSSCRMVSRPPNRRQARRAAICQPRVVSRRAARVALAVPRPRGVGSSRPDGVVSVAQGSQRGQCPVDSPRARGSDGASLCLGSVGRRPCHRRLCHRLGRNGYRHAVG